jgi:SAM-dependent methyltransferase
VNAVVWHDLECGSYAADLPLWRSLAEREGGPILEIGAGTGRVAVDLARRGHRVTALDNDPELVDELGKRARGLELTVVLADARSFELERMFALCLVPMQTIQVLGGAKGRQAFLERARRHLRRGGILAIALTEELEPYESGSVGPSPLPDICERDGVLYASQPTAIRAENGQLRLERQRETVTPNGKRTTARYSVGLDLVTSAQLESESRAAGLVPAGRATIAATRDYAGSEVVMVRA